MRVLTTILMAMAACAVGLGCMRPPAEARSTALLVGNGMLAQGEAALV
jgi:hypothetical protein